MNDFEFLIVLIAGLGFGILTLTALFIYQTLRQNQLEKRYRAIAQQAGMSYQPGPEWCPHRIVGQHRGREFLLEGLVQRRFQTDELLRLLISSKSDPVIDPMREIEFSSVRIKLTLKNTDFVTLKLVGRNWLGALLSYEAKTRFERLFLISMNPANFETLVLNEPLKVKLMAAKRPFSINIESYELAYEQDEPLDNAATALALFELLSDIGDRVEALQGVEVVRKTK